MKENQVKDNREKWWEKVENRKIIKKNSTSSA